ncbi:MAG: LamG domain-containing protein [Candidatus Bathyarchaeota archaeon]|jgi:photosystem II stability/assembly factor-like uncharacterized protein
MTLLFSESGMSENAEVSNPALQGLFIPAIDNPVGSDGFGISIPWGGGDSARNYSEYGPSQSNSAEATQLRDLADISFGGNISFDTEGLIGPQGVQGPTGPQGPQGIPGVAFFPTNFITDFSEIQKDINSVWGSDGSADTMLYASEVIKKWNITWLPFDIDSGVSAWNDVCMDLDGSFISIASNGSIFLSTDSGSNWSEKIPEVDNFSAISCNTLGSKIVTIGDNSKSEGNIWTSDDYGENWSEVAVTGDDQPTGSDLCSGTTDPTTLSDSVFETRSIAIDTPITLTSGTQYAIVVGGVGINGTVGVYWLANVGSYPNGSVYHSHDAGVTWDQNATGLLYDSWFQTFEGAAYRDQYTPTGSNGWQCSNLNWFAQTFVASSTYEISKINLKLKRNSSLSAGTLTVGIRAVAPSGTINDAFLGAGGSFVTVATSFGVSLSTDFGSNWSYSYPDGGATNWERIICSTDGTYIYTWDDNDNIYRTANGGTSWASTTPAGGDTFSPNDIAISSTGQFVIIVGSNSTDTSKSAYLSSDYGVTWTVVNPTSNVVVWDECTIDNSGNTMTVVDSSLGYFYASFDGGTTWKSQNIPATSSDRSSIAISGDGSLGVVCNTDDNNEVFYNSGYYSELTITDTPITSAGRSLMDDDTAVDQVVTLGFTETAEDISDHIFSDGSDHLFINQDVTISSSPTFVTTDLTDITDSNIPFVGAGGFEDSPITTDGVDITVSGNIIADTIDLNDITDGNVPYMSGSGFADSPLTTDGTDLVSTGNLTISHGDFHSDLRLIATSCDLTIGSGTASTVDGCDYTANRENKGVALRMFPNGTSQLSTIQLSNDTDTSNFSGLGIRVDEDTGYIEPLAAGTPATPLTVLDITVATTFSSALTADDVVTVNADSNTQDIYPLAEDMYSLGRVDKSWNSCIIMDTTNGKPYRIEVISGSLTATSILEADLSAYYKMNDNAASTDVIDETGVNNGTAQQNTEDIDTTGLINGALTFNGSSDYIDGGNDSSLDWGSGDGTIMCIFKRNGNPSGDEVLVIKGAVGGGQKTYMIRLNSSGQVNFWMDDNVEAKQVTTTGGSYCDNEWHVIFAIRDGNNMRLIVDTEVVTPTDITSLGDIDDTENLTLGAYNLSGSQGDSGFFGGAMDCIMIWARALDSNEYGWLYNSGSGREI